MVVGGRPWRDGASWVVMCRTGRALFPLVFSFVIEGPTNMESCRFPSFPFVPWTTRLASLRAPPPPTTHDPTCTMPTTPPSRLVPSHRSPRYTRNLHNRGGSHGGRCGWEWGGSPFVEIRARELRMLGRYRKGHLNDRIAISMARSVTVGLWAEWRNGFWAVGRSLGFIFGESRLRGGMLLLFYRWP